MGFLVHPGSSVVDEAGGTQVEQGTLVEQKVAETAGSTAVVECMGSLALDTMPG
jgi:hypothetical protein